MDDRIITLAANQHGVVRRAQLLAAGVTSREVDRLLAGGGLRRMHAGVYLLGHLRGELEPERARVMAAVLAGGQGALLSHWPAAWLLELAPKPTPAAPIDIRIPPGRTRVRRPGIRVHTSSALPAADATSVDGVPATSPLRTIEDLATVADRRALERVVARAERNGLVTLDAMKARAERRRGRRGGPVLLAVLAQEGGPDFLRSELEERFRDLLAATGLPRPRFNAVVLGREVDCYWPGERLIVELDGYAWHRSRRSRDNDRRRDGDFVASGIRVLRLTWQQVVEEPKKTLVTVTRALAARAPGGSGEAGGRRAVVG